MKKLSLFLLPLLIVACQPKEQEGPDNAAQVSKLYDAFAAGDMETVLSYMATDIQWSEAENFVYDYGKPLVGPDAVVEGVFAKLGSEWEYWNLVDKNFENIGDSKVLVTGRYNAKNKATGKVLDAQFAHVLTLNDTIVTNFQQYTDTKQAADVVALEMVEEVESEETGS